jgi:outer membrane autotransporter protein
LLKNLLTTVSTLAVITTAVTTYAALDSDEIYNQSVLAKAGINQAAAGMNDAAWEDTIKRLTPTETPILADLTRDVSSNIIANRIGGRPQVLDHKAELASAGNSGLSAGDYPTAYGLWTNPSMLKVKQKTSKGAAGYKASVGGASLGFDTKANEDMVIGLALSYLNTHVKHKDFKSGDKTKVGTILFSAYSNYQFGNNWFGPGVFSIGSSNVTNKEKRRISTTNYAIASAEYSSMTFASEVLGGYNHLVNNQLVLTPMFGVGYSRINDSSYQETGNGPQLLSVTKRASQKVELVGGLRVTGLPFIVGEVSLTPEMHGSVRHDVIGKGARVDAKIPGLPKLPSEKAKLQKTY